MILRRFQVGLGMELVAKSDQSTGNPVFASYVLQSNDLKMVFTAPYSRQAAASTSASSLPAPNYVQQQAYDFLNVHGMAVRAVGATSAARSRCCHLCAPVIFSTLSVGGVECQFFMLIYEK